MKPFKYKPGELLKTKYDEIIIIECMPFERVYKVSVCGYAIFTGYYTQTELDRFDTKKINV